MNDLDRKILAAIKADTSQSTEDYSKELGLFGLIGQSFKGSHAWVVILATALILIFLSLTIYCGYHMYHTDIIVDKINWLAASLVFFIIFGLLRLWYFMELNRLSIRRQIKRLELMVSLLITNNE